MTINIHHRTMLETLDFEPTCPSDIVISLPQEDGKDTVSNKHLPPVIPTLNSDVKYENTIEKKSTSLEKKFLDKEPFSLIQKTTITNSSTRENTHSSPSSKHKLLPENVVKKQQLVTIRTFVLQTHMLMSEWLFRPVQHLTTRSFRQLRRKRFKIKLKKG